jgi:hypothetical protein
VYWLKGLDLRAMKVVTVFTFVVFLAAFAVWVRPLLPSRVRPVAVVLVGLSPAFWSYRDLIASEFPYLMFSFLSLVAIRRAFEDLDPKDWRVGRAFLVAILLYATYSTRTIGIALPAAMVCTDLTRFKRPSRFLILSLCFLAVLIGFQTLLISSPKGYVSAAHFSAVSIVANVSHYAKSLTYAWPVGSSKPLQVVLALVLTIPAAIAYWQRLRREQSTEQFYLIIYLSILIAWGAQIGIRGLLPILPCYITYALLGLTNLLHWMRARRLKIALVGSLAALIGISYLVALHQSPWQASIANVADLSAQQMFVFLRAHTTSSDLIVFPKPRSIALYTGRRAASLGPDETPDDALDFLQRTGATILIQTAWTPPSWSRFISSHRLLLTEVFHNGDFQVFRIQPESIGLNENVPATN